MNTPFFSIIIPVYKVDKEFLDLCIKSVVSQTFNDCEVILVDDGCPAGGGALCDAYAGQYSNVSVIHQSNQGVSAARNAGLDAASGEWILFIDADDWIEKDTCAVLKKHIESGEFDFLHFCGFRETPGKSRPMNYGLKSDRAYDMTSPQEREYIYRKVINNRDSGNKPLNTMYYSCDKVFRRSFLIENKLRYPEGIKISEDRLFFLSCLERTSEYHYVPELLYHYRIHGDSATHHFTGDFDEDRIRMFGLLEPIVKRLDEQLGEMKKEADYHKLQEEYLRLIFFSIPDILRMKYYHKDYNAQKSRRWDVIRFLEREPFNTALAYVSGEEFDWKNRTKRWLLSKRLIYIHMLLCKVLDLKRGFV